jgi:hypothetical protein
MENPMTGYTIKKTLPDEIILGQPGISIVLYIMAGIGILFLMLLISAKYKIINPPDITLNIFAGMGIIFTAGSTLFMIQKTPDTITFSKSKSEVIFSENSQIYSRSFADFNKLLITGKLSHSENSSSNIFQLDLISNNGSSLILCESDKKNDLQKIAESLILYIDINLISGADIIHEGRGSYTRTEPVYPDHKVMSIKSDISGYFSVYTWHNRKSFFSILLLGAVIYGFNFLFFTSVFPVLSGFNIGLYVGGFILILLDIMFAWIVTFNTFGRNIAEVSGSSFSYKQKLFGFSLNSRTFSSSDIALISSGFTSDNDKITIFTKRGLDIFNELRIFAAMNNLNKNNLNEKSLIMTLFPKIMELRNNIIEIDGNMLYYYEKLYLENKWCEKLKGGSKNSVLEPQGALRGL